MLQETQTSIFDDEVELNALRRKDLLPWWIKGFNWLFMFLGGLSVIILIAGIAGMEADLAMYGLSTRQPLSPSGLALMGIFLLSGIAAYGLWAEKNWGVNVAMVCAFVGIVVCIYTMIVPQDTTTQKGVFNIRFELVFLFFFLRKLLKIRNEWDTRVGA